LQKRCRLVKEGSTEAREKEEAAQLLTGWPPLGPSGRIGLQGLATDADGQQ
jgi:hypothetical protein